jgi:hypothetical protein
MTNTTETSARCEQTNDVSAVELPTIKRDGCFYAGIACLVVAATIMPLSLSIVPLLGLSATKTAIVLGMIATIPDSLCVVAIGLLGTEVFRYLILRAKNGLRSFAEGRFRAGGPGPVIISVIQRMLDRLLQLVELYAVPIRFCRNAVTYLFAAPAAISLVHN